MPEETDDPPQPPPEQPTLLGSLAPDEMFARGMQSVKMTSGTAAAWQPPTLEEAAQLFRGYEVLKLLGRGAWVRSIKPGRQRWIVSSPSSSSRSKSA